MCQDRDVYANPPTHNMNFVSLLIISTSNYLLWFVVTAQSNQWHRQECRVARLSVGLLPKCTMASKVGVCATRSYSKRGTPFSEDGKWMQDEMVFVRVCLKCDICVDGFPPSPLHPPALHASALVECPEVTTATFQHGAFGDHHYF